jgi:hypothetical protein
MPATYEPIATTTLGSAAASISISSIPATYTDLILIATGVTTDNGVAIFLRFNSDTSSVYSQTRLGGDGSSATSGSNTGLSFLSATGFAGSSSTIPSTRTINIFSYAGSTNKTILGFVSEDRNGSGAVTNAVGLWRNTAAITSVSLTPSSGNLATGYTATLYGIKNA